MFKGFKPQAMQKIASSMGYQGPIQDFDAYLEQNPDKKREMVVYEVAIIIDKRSCYRDDVVGSDIECCGEKEDFIFSRNSESWEW